jgi:hypothetical protein
VIKKQGVTITKWMCVCMFIEEGIVHWCSKLLSDMPYRPK